MTVNNTTTTFRIKLIIILGCLIIGPFLALCSPAAGGADTFFETMSLESKHNYDNNYDHTWIVERPGAASIRLLFQLIEIEGVYDVLYVLDGANNVVWHTTTTEYGKRTYTNEYVIVYDDVAKIRLVTDGSIYYYGFKVAQTAWSTVATTESAHPYGNNQNLNWYLKTPTGNRMYLKFTELDLEKGYDYLRLYDADTGALLWSYTNGGTYPGTPVYNYCTSWFYAHYVRLNLVTDGSVTRWGFKFETIWSEVGDDDNYAENSVLAVHNYQDPNTPDVNITDANNFASHTMDYGYFLRYNDRDAAVDDNDFYSTGDNVDLIYWAGHGTVTWDDCGEVCLDGWNCWWAAPSDSYWRLDDEHSLGDVDSEWAFLVCCDVLDYSAASNSAQMLYHGAHAVFGFDSSVSDSSAKSLESRLNYDLWYQGMTLYASFCDACVYAGIQGGAALIHSSTISDHYWQCGKVYPDPASNNDIYWYDVT